MSSINKMAGARSSCGGFQDQSFAFQDWKYADKRHKWKEKVQKNAQVPFCGQTKAFRYNIVFRGIQPCFLPIGSAWLVLNQQGSEVSKDTWDTFRTLWSKKSTFVKGNICILKVSWTFCTFWHRRERKPTKCAFEIFCHVLDRFNFR